jgi:hypothetical protein
MFYEGGKRKRKCFKFHFFVFNLGGEFSVIFYVATFLFIVCSIATLTSIREEPLISSPSSSSRDNGDNGDAENPNEDEMVEIGVDEKHPLLPSRRNSSRPSYNTSNKADRSTAQMYLNGLNNQEGFVEIDAATGRHIPHDHVEGTGETILLQALECSHQVVSASMGNADSSGPGPTSQAFAAELRQKTKLVKLGIQSFLIFSLY